MNRFNSDNYIFRPTALSDALVRAGMAKDPVFVREAKKEGLLHNYRDTDHSQPSIRIELKSVRK